MTILARFSKIKITALNSSTTATVAIAGLAFSLSFTALEDLAAQNGIPAGQAWSWPLIVDGLTVVSTAATVALKSHRWFAWVLLVAGTVLSVWGNAIHAAQNNFGPIGVFMSSVVPVILLAVTHQTVLLYHQRVADKEAVEATVAGVDAPAAQTVPVAVKAAPVAEPAPAIEVEPAPKEAVTAAA